MNIVDTNKQVELFLNWLESKVAEANPVRTDLWVIKINNDDLTDKDKEMISLINNSTSDFISLLYKKGYNEFEIGIDSVSYTNCTEIRYTKKHE